MAADIAPELYEKIKKIFDEKYKKAQLWGSPISDTLGKLKSGEATFRDADMYAVEVGSMLSDSLKEVLNLDEMPDNRLYYNIAKRTIGQSLEDAYGLVSSTANEIIEEMNQNAGIKLKAVKGTTSLNDDWKTRQVINKACEAKTNEELQTALGNPVVNCVQKAADETLQRNLEFQAKAGMEVTVTRIYDHIGLRRKTKHAEVCSWCKEREGTDVPYKKAYARGMFQRHEGCGCIIDYVSKKGEKTRSTSKYSGFDKVEEPEKKEINIISSNENNYNAKSKETIALLRQETETAKIPDFLKGNFEGFCDLEITKDEKECLTKLHTLSIKNGFEYGVIGINGKIGNKIFSDKNPNGVGVPISKIDEKGIKVYHSHTNDTLPSIADIKKLIQEKVDSVITVTRNGDVYVVKRDYGWIPDSEEFELIAEEIRKEAHSVLMEQNEFLNATEEERKYMLFREQTYRLVRRFEWTIQGGKLDE